MKRLAKMTLHAIILLKILQLQLACVYCIHTPESHLACIFIHCWLQQACFTAFYTQGKWSAIQLRYASTQHPASSGMMLIFN